MPCISSQSIYTDVQFQSYPSGCNTTDICVPNTTSISESYIRALCGGDVPCGQWQAILYPYNTPCGFSEQRVTGLCCTPDASAPSLPLEYYNGVGSGYLHRCDSEVYNNDLSGPMLYNCHWELANCDFCYTSYDYLGGRNCCTACSSAYECYCEGTDACEPCDKEAITRADISCEWDLLTCELTCVNPCSGGEYWNGTSCVYVPPGEVSFVRHLLTGRLYVSYIESNNLKVDIYTDSQIDTVGSTVSVDSSGTCSAPKITCGDDGVITIIYTSGSNAKITQSRDAGVTWTVTHTLVTTGYQLATYGIPATMSGYSIIPVMLWNDSKWYVKVGVKTGASTYTFSSAVQVVASAAALPGTLLQRKDGVWEFLYTALPNTKTIVRCKALRSDGTGTWS